MVEVLVTGQRLFALYDHTLKGFLTWYEQRRHKGKHCETRAVLMFTTGERAEEHIHKVIPARHEHVAVCTVRKARVQAFIFQMLRAQIYYALIDAPPTSFDQLAEGIDFAQSAGDLHRDYMIVDLRKLAPRFM